MCCRINLKASIIIVTVICTAHVAESFQAQYPNATSLRNKRQSACRRNQFTCNNGECVPRLHLCDGKKSCKDGSDETEQHCRSVECPKASFTFECSYGACISRSSKCDGNRDCMDGSDEQNCSTLVGCNLPEHVPYGKFRLGSGGVYAPGQSVPSSTLISLYCNEDEEALKHFFCLKNEWGPPLDGFRCPKPGTCKSVKKSSSEEVFCKFNNLPISCEEPPNGTTASVRCLPFYTFNGYRPIYRCESGKWDQQIVPCYPECGTKRVAANTLILGGTEATKNEYPWVAAVYNSTNNHICGATVISRRFVLSAAHCFTDINGKHNSKDEYSIVCGKHHRDINFQEDSAQKRRIKKLHVHEDYRGRLQKYRDDIALIELDTSLSISLQTQPICIDWDTLYEDFDFQDGNPGAVAGWGYTRASDSPSDVLKKLVVPFRSRPACMQQLPADFSQEYFTTDKICAGSADQNANVCSGDSGGGLVFQSNSQKFYLRGIVSIAVKSEIGCDANSYALYTRVSKYLVWVEDKTKREL